LCVAFAFEYKTCANWQQQQQQTRISLFHFMVFVAAAVGTYLVASYFIYTILSYINPKQHKL
jgi:hypothetical protein